MNEHAQHVTAAFDAVRIHSTTTFSWFGLESSRMSPRVGRLLTSETARSYLIFSLQSKLYEAFYARGGAARVASLEESGTTRTAPDYVEQLSRANAGLGYWA